MSFRRTKGPRYTRKDKNHDDICRRLRMFPGILVWETVDVGGGYPDVTVACVLTGKMLLVEIKPKGKEHRLTKHEVVFHERWKQFTMVASDVPEILDALEYPDANIWDGE